MPSSPPQPPCTLDLLVPFIVDNYFYKVMQVNLVFDQAVGIAPCVAAALHRRLSQQNIMELLTTQRLPTEI